MTAQQIADATGLKVRTVHRRIQFGLPIEGPPRMGPQPRRFEFRGRLATVAEIMVATGLSRSQVSKRTDGVRFFERDEATDPNAPLHPSCRVLFLDGIADSVSGWSRRLGISREVITYRLKQGWSVRQTLTTPVARANGCRTAPSTPGGTSQTFPAPPRTGAHSLLHDLHGENDLFKEYDHACDHG